MSELVSISNMEPGHLLALAILLLFAGGVLFFWVFDKEEYDG